MTRGISMELQELRTPCYIVNEDDYKQNIEELVEAYNSRWPGTVVYGYSVKTNHLPYMAKIAFNMGWLIEVVSPDEYEFAKACGANETEIIYNGPQKRGSVIDAIIAGSIVNLDNLMEVELVCSNASKISKSSSRIGIRINFNLESDCPGETTCRDVVGRFGICYENGDVKKALNLLKQSGIKMSGIHLHSSSSSRSTNIFKAIAKKAIQIIKEFELYNIDYIDIGGGFFGGNLFSGKPSVQQYAEVICHTLLEGLGQDKCRSLKLVLEPGAAVLATSMDYLVSVLNIRDIRGERVVTVDGSVIHINPMMNPHETPCTIINPGNETKVKQVIGGSTCMEMDRLWPRNLHQLVEMDTQLLFHACGAYMSTHNSSFINAAPNIYVKKDGVYSYLRRKNIESMMKY